MTRAPSSGVRMGISRRHGQSGGAGCAVILVVAACLAGAAALFLLTQHLDRAASHQWPRVPATIVASGVEGHGGADSTGPYRLALVYRYEVNGVEHEGTRWRLDDHVDDEVGPVLRIADRLSPGDRTEAFVDPADPTRAVLEPGGSMALAIVAVVVAAFAVLALVGAVLVFRYRHWSGDDDRSVLRDSGALHPLRSRLALLAFFGFFFAFGAIFPVAFVIRPHLQAREALSWPEVDCVVIASEVRSHRGSDSTTYSADILFEYEFAGRTYRSSRARADSVRSGNRGPSAELVRAYPAGTRATCRVDPADPYRAVLVPTPPSLLGLGLITLIFPTVGLIGIVGTLFSMRRATVSVSSSDRGTSGGGTEPWRSPLQPDSPDAPRASTGLTGGSASRAGPGLSDGWGAVAGPDGALELCSSASQVGKAVGIWIFALIWNGGVWIAIASFGRGLPTSLWDLIPALFALLFVGVGLLVLAFAIHATLALTNPKVTMRMATSRFPLGVPVRAEWACIGGRRPIQHLTIELVGRESATYRRGSSTTTERHEFAVIPLVDTEDRATIEAGTFELRAPANGVPSFKSTNNAIEWLLRVRGRIPRWPDVSSEHVIEVAGPTPAAPNAPPPMEARP